METHIDRPLTIAAIARRVEHLDADLGDVVPEDRRRLARGLLALRLDETLVLEHQSSIAEVAERSGFPPSPPCRGIQRQRRAAVSRAVRNSEGRPPTRMKTGSVHRILGFGREATFISNRQ